MVVMYVTAGDLLKPGKFGKWCIREKSLGTSGLGALFLIVDKWAHEFKCGHT